MDTPKYLYHYTSVESLALILENSTIRLNSLDRMDDLQEKETKDLKGLGSFCYVSSWTDDHSEQIPMWKMYTDLKAGVRIRLKTLPFKTYPLTQEHIDKYLNHISRTAIPSDMLIIRWCITAMQLTAVTATFIPPRPETVFGKCLC